MYGIHKPKKLENASIEKIANRYGVPRDRSYTLSEDFITFLSELDSTEYSEKQIKNHYQPLQVLYFDTTHLLCSYQVNCNVGGFPNLQWNKFGAFDHFPPTSQASLDSILRLPEQIEFLKGMGEAIPKIETGNYWVVVYWSRFMGRQSKRLIKMVKENLGLTSGQEIKLYFVNNDNVMVRMFEE